MAPPSHGALPRPGQPPVADGSAVEQLPDAIRRLRALVGRGGAQGPPIPVEAAGGAAGVGGGPAAWWPAALLVAFCGSSKGQPEASRVRSKLIQLCEAHPSECHLACRRMETEGGMETEATPLLMRQQSVFCLEPPGYGKMRRSAMDSFLLGCIPVLFLRDAEMDQYLPTHMGGWARNATVLVDPEAFLRGEVDVLARLRRMPDERVRHMQGVLGRNAHRLMYSLDTHRNDAIGLLLREMFRRLHLAWARPLAYARADGRRRAADARLRGGREARGMAGRSRMWTGGSICENRVELEAR